jgi:hypothetical protein
MIGFDVDTLSYVLGMFLCYPLGMLMNQLPYGKIRHVANFVFGAFLMQFSIGSQWIHPLITSLVVYALFCTLPRKLNATLVPVFAMLYLVFGHLHRQYVSYLGWDLDFTGIQMVLTQKLYIMAFNLYDGEQIAKGKPSKAAQKCAPFALQQLPGFVEYLGYVFSFSNVLSGPTYEYSIYNAASDGSLLYDSNGKIKGEKPSNVWPTVRPLLTCLACLATFVVMGSHFPILDPTDPKRNTPVVLQSDFLVKPWFQRYAYLWLGLLAVRQKYYFAWKNAEGANNIWYAGFNGFDENGKSLGWTNADNVSIWEFETAPNVQTLSREWNKKTSSWLTRYVYIRTNGNLGAVYGMSAFWHGFYPGYYLFFLSVPLMTMCERLGRKKVSPQFPPEKWSPYGIVCILATSFVVEYMVSAFTLLAFDRAWLHWKSHYFLGHILCILCYVALTAMPSGAPKKKVE